MLDALTLDQLRILVSIADHGSFRAAGLHLQRAQSSISHAIARMEAELGVTLFDRSTRKPAFTQAAKALLADVRAILLKVALLKARTQGMGEGVELVLRVAVDSQFPDGVMAQALMTLQREYPTVAISVHSTSLGGPLQALDQGRCDLAIVGDSVALSSVALEALTNVVRVAVTAPEHDLAPLANAGRPLSLEDLSDHVQIVVGDTSSLTEGRDFHVLSPRIWYANDNAMKKALLLAGAGWGSLPLWMVAADLESGRLLRVPVLEFGAAGETEIRLYLAHRVNDSAGPAAARLRELLREEVTV